MTAGFVHPVQRQVQRHCQRIGDGRGVLEIAVAVDGRDQFAVSLAQIDVDEAGTAVTNVQLTGQ
jgi:hypothetical protein